MARDSANASSFQERSATLRLAVSALPAFRGSVPRQVLRARQYSHINTRGPNSQPILGKHRSVPIHLSCFTRNTSHVCPPVSLGNGGLLYRETYTHARKHKHTQTACSFLRIISLWSVSAWLGKAHFLPSVHSLQDHTNTHTHTRSTCINSSRL